MREATYEILEDDGSFHGEIPVSREYTLRINISEPVQQTSDGPKRAATGECKIDGSGGPCRQMGPSDKPHT